MHSTNDLITRSVTLLKTTNISEKNFSRPHFPSCIAYFGKQSAAAHPAFYEDITRGWGGNSDFIVYFVADDPEAGSFTCPIDGDALTASQIQEQLQRQLTEKGIFADMSFVNLYCVLDTSDITDAAEFESWYRCVTRLEELLSCPTQTQLMIILDESIKKTALAASVKNRLCDLYESDTAGLAGRHMYDAVFIFSNKLRNGAFVDHDYARDTGADYNLFADMVLLTNSRGTDYSKRRTALYGSDRPAMSAAYGWVRKPMREIALITLSAMLKRLRTRLTQSAQPVTGESLAVALGIKNGRSDIHESFQKSISPQLPQSNFLEYMPTKSSPDRTFDEFDRATDGCLRAFIDYNHFDIIDRAIADNRRELAEQIASGIIAHADAARLSPGVPVPARETAYARAVTSVAPSAAIGVSGTIELLVRNRIADGISAITDEVLDELIKSSAECVAAYGEITEELGRQYSIGEEGTRRNLVDFYGEIVNRRYSDANKLTSLYNRVFKPRNKKEDVLRALYDEMSDLFAADPVFRLPFAEELIERLGKMAVGTREQEYIAQELIRNLDDNVSFSCTSTFHGRTFEAYLLGTSDETSNVLYKYLDERELPPEVSRTFFNTCSNDMAESIWFYICTTDNLRY